MLDERLYLKANDVTRNEFESRGLSQFIYTTRGKTVRLSYYEAPAEVFEEPESMCEWARRALAAASRPRGGAARTNDPKARRASWPTGAPQEVLVPVGF